jgi:glycosyltransferase involved in cell wall biosynthesis
MGKFNKNGDTFFIYSRRPINIPNSGQQWRSRIDSLPFMRFIDRSVWLRFRAGLMCLADKIDVFWGGSSFLPILPRRVRTVLTVHDINYKLFPETMHTRSLLSHHLFFKKDIKRADMVLSNSDGTSRRLYDHFGRRATAAIRPSVSKLFRPYSEQDVQQFKASHGINYPYILALSTLEPRKNFQLLVSTFLRMKSDGLLGNYKLLIVGKKGWKSKLIMDLISNDHGVNIRYLDYVQDEYLPIIYSGADAFVYPSIYEGFGIPVLEARVCRTKIVTTDIPELHEAGGPDAIYIEPTSEGIREGILSAVFGIKNLTIEEKQLAFPTWEDGANLLYKALNGSLI